MSEATAEQNPPRGALGIIFLIVFVDLLGFGIIIPLLPFLVPNYRENALQVTLLFSIYSICQFIAAPILGAISDRIGRRPVLAVSQMGSAAGYVLLGIAAKSDPGVAGTTLALVYLSRIIDGLSGGNISTAQAYISDVTTEKNRAKGMGILGAAFGIGFSLGPAVGGILGHYDRAWPAYLAAALSAAAGVLSWTRLPESRPKGRVDVEAWLHPRQFLPVLRRPVLLQLLLISFVSMAAFVMMEATVGIFLNARFGFEQKQVGWFFAWAGLWIVIVQGGLIGRLTRRLGEWPLAIVGPVLVAVGMGLFVAVGWGAALGVLLLGGAVNAIGRSFQGPTLSALLSKYSERDEQGVVFGLFHGLSSMARVIGPIAAGLVFHWWRNTGPYLVSAAVVLVAAAWSIWVRAMHPLPVRVEPIVEPTDEAARAEVE